MLLTRIELKNFIRLGTFKEKKISRKNVTQNLIENILEKKFLFLEIF